jgi:hypothetical protein
MSLTLTLSKPPRTLATLSNTPYNLQENFPHNTYTKQRRLDATIGLLSQLVLQNH